MMWLDTILKYIPVIGSIRKALQDQYIIKLGLQSLLRSQMLEIYYNYKDKEMPIHMKEQFQDLYNSYHMLGGNGVMTSIYNEVIKCEKE